MNVYLAIAGFALMTTAFAGYVLSHATTLDSYVSSRGLNLCLLATWLISKSFAAWVGLTFFQSALEAGATFESLIVRITAPEFVLLALIWIASILRLSVSNRPRVYYPAGSRPEWEKRE